MAKSNTQYTTKFFVDLTNEKQANILYVDDDASLLKVTKQCLEMTSDFQVDTTFSVKEAKKLMNQKTYDIIVSDYMMTGKNGLDFLRELRDDGNTIPFIIFTGKGREEVAVQALNLGADQYINKFGDPKTVYSELTHSLQRALERERASRNTRESEEKFRNIFENASDAMIYLDRTGRILDANKKTIELHGGTKEELVGKHFAKMGMLSPEDTGKLMKAFTVESAGKHSTFNVCIRNREDQKISLECKGSLTKMSGETTLLVIARDITKHKQAEHKWKKSEEKYKTLLEETPIGICNLDMKGKITYANKTFEQLLGYSRDEILGKSALKLARQAAAISDKMMKPIANRIKNRLMGRRKSQPMIIQLRPRDGTVRWVEAESKLIKKFGIPVGLQAILRDITERKQTEEKLKASEERFRSIVENSHGGIGIVDDKFKIKYINEQVTQIIGYSKKDMIGQDFRKFLPDKAKSLIQNRYVRRQRGEKIPSQYEFEMTRKDGKTITIEMKVTTQQDNQGRIQILAEVLDITGRKRAYRALRESEEKFQQLFMGNPEAAVYVDSNFQIMEVNPRFIELFGYSSNEAMNKSVNDLIVPDDKIKEAKLLDKNSKKGYVYQDGLRKRKDGTLVSVAISAAPIIIEKKLVGHVALYKDISLLKQTEKTLRNTLEKLRVVGGLTRHDVRNKLSAINGNTYLIQKKLPPKHEAQEQLKDSESALKQIEEIFNFARTYEKLGVEELSYVDSGKSFEEALSLFPDLHNVKILNGCRGISVRADSLLRLFFYNLIDNSLKHGEKVSQIRFYSEKIKKNEGDVEEKDEYGLKLVYEDNGIGIPMPRKGEDL